MNDTSLIEKMREREEILWLNPGLNNRFSGEITAEDVAGAAARLGRFAPYLAVAFPETNGVIESPLREISQLRGFLTPHTNGSPREGTNTHANGRLFLKCDSHLPVSGSIKARGGIYEVLCFAEKVAQDSGLLRDGEDYAVLAEGPCRRLFSGYSIAVGSTGNLGLSIGIMGTRLGFRVTVHMSADARQWKKDLLREKGATVVEYAGDYEKAVAEGRRQAAADPTCHFVDDENSRELFLGYATAGERLKAQLDQNDILVDVEHPLFCYLPCGVGGGPGGVAYGIKQIFGAHAHCFFAEPVEAPAVLLGLMTGQHEKISALDIGLTGKTIADGLAVSRPSGLVCRIVGPLLDGCFTAADERMEQLVRDLYRTEGIFVEPSATPGLWGYQLVGRSSVYADRFANATHIVWATGGNMVPQAERAKYLK